MNVAIGISDKILVLCGSALTDAVNQLKYVHFSLNCNLLLLIGPLLVIAIDIEFMHECQTNVLECAHTQHAHTHTTLCAELIHFSTDIAA